MFPRRGGNVHDVLTDKPVDIDRLDRTLRMHELGGIYDLAKLFQRMDLLLRFQDSDLILLVRVPEREA